MVQLIIGSYFTLSCQEYVNALLFIFLIYFKGWERFVFHFKGQHNFWGGRCVFVESANMDNRLKSVLKHETHSPESCPSSFPETDVKPGLEVRQPQ